MKKCKSLNHCKHCQKPHHTLLHVDDRDDSISKKNTSPSQPASSITSSLHTSVSSNVLLMTCQVIVETPQGVIKAHALLDTGSSTSFMLERLAQSLQLCRHTTINGIAGLQHSKGRQAVTQFLISSIHSGTRYDVNAFIITGDLPVHPVTPN